MRANRFPANHSSIFALLAKALAFQPDGPAATSAGYALPVPAVPAGRGSFDRRTAGKSPESARREPLPDAVAGRGLPSPPYHESGWAMIACGFWVRAALIAALAAVAGAILLLKGDGNPAPAIALALGGGLLAPYAVRRIWALADREEAAAIAAKAIQPGPANQGA